MKRAYHTILSKPIDLFSSNVLVYCSVETFNIASSSLGCPLGILVSSSLIRILSVPVSYYLDSVKWYLPQSLSGPATKLHESLFLNNLEADVKNLKLTESEHKKLKSLMAPSVLVRQAVQSYFFVSFCRALHQISYNPQYYSGIETVYFKYFSLCAPDPFCIFPIFSGIFTYQLLKNANHPFTLNIKESTCYWIGLFTSLLFMPLPISYTLSYSSFIATHILIKKIFNKKI